jgi:GT2 family glycosyltransferase
MTESLRFTVVVPTRNRLPALARCLESLKQLHFPRERFNVVVVNDGGTDPRDVVNGVSDCLTISLLAQDHAGPAAARNTGAAKTTARALAFIDDDCVADPDWLSALSARLTASPDAVVGGRVVNLLDENVYARTSQTLLRHVYRYYHEERRGPLRFFTTNNMAAATATFLKVGGFDPGFAFACEDRDWSDRALFAGFDLMYEEAAVVRHAHDLTLLALLRQHQRYGHGAVRFHRRRASRRGERVHMEPIRFYAGMLAAPFVERDPQPFRLALLLAATQAAATAGFVQSLIGNRESGIGNRESGVVTRE